MSPKSTLASMELTATFDELLMTYAFSEPDELVLYYVTTIYKPQG